MRVEKRRVQLRTEVKLKEKLLKCKRTTQKATFNVRTLKKIGQLPELTASALDHNIDISCIQEHRYIHSEDIKYMIWMDASHCICMENTVNATIGDIGMLIEPQALKSLNSIKKIQPRMMVATFNGNQNATIFCCYSLTNVSEETDLIVFHNELSSLVRSIPKHNVLVIGRDMDAQIRKNVKHKFSLHNLSNRNGEHLTGFTLENRLTCLNTKFQKERENYATTPTEIIVSTDRLRLYK